jgi:hypothetical protein
MNYKSTLASVVAGLLLAAPGVAPANNGVSTNEFTFENSPFNDCLGEYWDVVLDVTQRSHLVTTRSGREHYIDNWFFTGTAVGQDSGYTYVTHGGGPLVVNSGGAQSTTILELALTWQPLEQGPKVLETWRFHLVQDANGMVRVYRDIPVNHRCIGRDK